MMQPALQPSWDADPRRRLRVLAVDDEELALRRIELALRAIPSAELVGKAFSGRQAAQLLVDARPDVVLLDVEMANVGGLELAAQLRVPGGPLVIFVTAFEDYAVEAFRLRAVDYVLKPLDFARLAAALDHAREALAAREAERHAGDLRLALARANEATDAAPTPAYTSDFWVDRLGEMVRVPVAQVDWLEAEGDYVRIHAGPASFLMRGPLSDIQAGLDPRLFARVRRSALVRIDRVRAIRRNGYADRRLLLSSGQEVRVGKTYLAAVRALLPRA